MVISRAAPILVSVEADTIANFVTSEPASSIYRFHNMYYYITCVFKMVSGMQSLISDHFTFSVNDDSKAICNYCKVLISRGGKILKTFGTTNLLKCLRLNHSSKYSSLEAAEKAREMENKDKTGSGTEKALDDHVLKVTPFGSNHPTARKITQAVTEMIALDNQPFSIVDD